MFGLPHTRAGYTSIKKTRSKILFSVCCSIFDPKNEGRLECPTHTRHDLFIKYTCWKVSSILKPFWEIPFFCMLFSFRSKERRLIRSGGGSPPNFEYAAGIDEWLQPPYLSRRSVCLQAWRSPVQTRPVALLFFWFWVLFCALFRASVFVPLQPHYSVCAQYSF